MVVIAALATFRDQVVDIGKSSAARGMDGLLFIMDVVRFIRFA